MSRLLGVFLCGAASISMALWSQEGAPLKARELFYKPLNATPLNVTPVKHPAQMKKAPARKSSSKPVTGETSMEAKVPSVLMHADYTAQPLGLKYTIVKQAGEQYREVDPESEFHTGDRIRVTVEANDAAYLYIVMQGSSGTWQVLFPNPGISGGNNRIERGKVYRIPPAELPSFYFDERPGTEKVSLILTRTPEQDLEKLIYATGERRDANGAGKTMLAQNAVIGGDVMGQVQQQMLSRDLVFEKADGNGPEGKAEKAMYVATPDTSAQARVYVDLKLIHK